MQPPASIALRPATPEDEPFMLAVYASTRADEMQLVDWADEQKQAFLRMQFNAQKTSYLNDIPNSEYSVILNNGVPVGRLIVDRSSTEVLLLADIALLPEYRNTGIGTSMIKDLKNEAAAKGQCLRLHVENFNPASKLYDRLGFKKVDEFSFYWRMEWNSAESVTQAVA